MLVKEGHLAVDSDQLCKFCERWKIEELALFGSALRDDFGPGSDLDFLLRFGSDAQWDFWQLGELQDELEGWLGRSVDLVQVDNLRNPIKRKRILETKQVIFESRQG